MVSSAGDVARRAFDSADKSVTDQYTFKECERMGKFMTRLSEVLEVWHFISLILIIILLILNISDRIPFK